ncbi:MAG: GLEYA domain-containing protein, partial [Planctomycetota bacterium]
MEKNMPVLNMRKLEATERTVSPPWARRLGHREAGLDPKVREEYWDNLGTFNGNVRASMLLVFVRGYLIPPAGGKYTFYVAGDDQGAFMLSSDDKPENMELLCFNREYARPQQYFQRGASQTSRAMELEAGKKYYFDAIFRDFGGRATFSVAWKYEGRQFPEIIDGKYLETLDGKKGLAKAHYYEAILVQKGNKNRYAVDDTQAHLLGFR